MNIMAIAVAPKELNAIKEFIAIGEILCDDCRGSEETFGCSVIAAVAILVVEEAIVAEAAGKESTGFSVVFSAGSL